ncbi:anti-sigma factor [Nakamurella sp. YIM 132087]|uniref:Anti-sigma factor n=1 Tax=Nakamurella alba TaxID=2665158 RepID=A0A7K1FM83_9ACTN|nr:zf-HC2 domain-containing protein [Nakamurella alba]MTD14429.1 anti-sigma factor [Nakamurella alba]
MTADDFGRRGPEHRGAAPDEEIHLQDAAYVLGALTPTDRQAYERHLAGCARCQESLRELAGLPGLLSMVDASVLAPADVPVMPPTMLPGVLDEVARHRRRRRWVTAGAMVAAAAVAAAVVVLVVPSSGENTAAPQTSAAVSTTAAPDADVELTAVEPGPMAVSVSLTDKQWGTSLTVHCRYYSQVLDNPEYQLIVVDKSAKEYDAGSWTSVPGETSTITSATFLHREDIARFEVRLSDGRVLLRSEG